MCSEGHLADLQAAVGGRSVSPFVLDQHGHSLLHVSLPVRLSSLETNSTGSMLLKGINRKSARFFFNSV